MQSKTESNGAERRCDGNFVMSMHMVGLMLLIRGFELGLHVVYENAQTRKAWFYARLQKFENQTP